MLTVLHPRPPSLGRGVYPCDARLSKLLTPPLAYMSFFMCLRMPLRLPLLLTADPQVGKLYGVATDAAAKHLTPLHDWLAAVPGAAAALATRERCLLTAATLEADAEAARGQLAAAEARAGGGAGGPAAVRKVRGSGVAPMIRALWRRRSGCRAGCELPRASPEVPPSQQQAAKRFPRVLFISHESLSAVCLTASPFSPFMKMKQQRQLRPTRCERS